MASDVYTKNNVMGVRYPISYSVFGSSLIHRFVVKKLMSFYKEVSEKTGRLDL